MSWFRLDFRLQRFELLAAILGATLWICVAFFLIAQMNAISGAHPNCFGHLPRGGPECPGVEDAFAIWIQLSDVVLLLGSLTPFVLAAFLGVTIVAREVETRTAELSWSLAVSRLRWLIGRTLPVAIILTGVLLGLGLVADLLGHARLGGADPILIGHEQRGLSLPIRGLFALGMSVLVGAVVGRTLPALVVGLASMAVATVLTASLLGVIDRRSAVVVTYGEGAQRADLVGGLFLGNVYIQPDGSIVDATADTRVTPDMSNAFRILPAREFWPVTMREGIAFITLGGISWIMAAVITRHRRPL